MNTKKDFRFPNIGWLVLRVGIGIGLATHGFDKLFTFDLNGTRVVKALSSIVATIGFPYPLFFSYAAALSEFVGGILIAVGLFGRTAGFFAMVTMGVAFYRSQQSPFQNPELAMIYFVGCVAVLFAGSGPYSVDSFVIRQKNLIPNEV